MKHIEVMKLAMEALDQMYKRAASLDTLEASDRDLQNLADNPMSGEIALEAQEVLFIRGAITALREALKDVPESNFGNMEQPAQQEPDLTAAYMSGFYDGKKAVSREPLTDEQSENAYWKTSPFGTYKETFIAGVRYAEAAHDIKEKT